MTPKRSWIQYGSMARDRQLFQLIDLFRPQSIVEVGTWNGKNAVNMIKHAQQYHKTIQYIGYDLFEDATAETDAQEFNVKAHNAEEAVHALIMQHCPDAEICLYKGNTRQTLKSLSVDFAFIDGGHSVETIAHDYNALNGSKIIVMDDYYTPDENGVCPDIAKVGCNFMTNQHVWNCKTAILPVKDHLKDGGMNQMILVL